MKDRELEKGRISLTETLRPRRVCPGRGRGTGRGRGENDERAKPKAASRPFQVRMLLRSVES